MTQPLQNQQYALGLTEFTYVDYSRTFDGQPRTLEVTMWYPTTDTEPLQKMHKVKSTDHPARLITLPLTVKKYMGLWH